MNEGIYETLKKRYPAGQYEILREVRNAAGMDAGRSCDFMVMGLWPSRGIHLTGIEQKRSRADWLNEIKQPEKAETFFQYCDFWYLLTIGPGVAKLDEIPEQWGWLSIENVNTGKIIVKKEAPMQKPISLTRTFLAAMLKRACDKKGWITEKSITERINESYKRGQESARSNRDRAEEQLTELKERVRAFEKASGIDLSNRWDYQYRDVNPEKLGEAVKYLQAGGAQTTANQLLTIQSAVTKILEDVNKHLSMFTLPEKTPIDNG